MTDKIENVPGKLKRKWNTPCFENLNQLPWVAGFGVQSHGVRVGVRVGDASLIPMLRSRLPEHVRPYSGDEYDTIFSVVLGGTKPGTRIRNFHLVYQNHDLCGRAHRLEEALDRFESSFSLMVAFLAPRRVFVHAGVVGVNGKAIIVPGKTLSGKSTLISELVRAGATYYSDEYAVLDNRGRVFPWHKPISMRATPTSKQVDMPIEEFGGKSGYRSLTPGLVLLTQYKQNARWRPKELQPGAAILGLLENCIGGRLAPNRVLTALEGVVSEARTVKTKRGNARELAHTIMDSMANAA